jgi:hypothetical protein
MNKRIQIILSDDAKVTLDKLYNEAKSGFKVGTIKISDLVSEIILNTKIDVNDVRAKYTDLRKSLKELAITENVDLDLAIKTLSELKGKYQKKVTKSKNSTDGDV